MDGEKPHVTVSTNDSSSGTMSHSDNFADPSSQNSSSTSLPSENDSVEPSQEEEQLDSNEVLELQGFIDKRAWIMEKINVLEKMPPVEVFVGLDAVQASAEDIPGLPSRSELRQWLIDHDNIEKETEIFDTGELKKLRKFTRAATKRNLSPQDTDLIEVTLTTIYELDKLLHLLRDRSENLDLLGTRMTWEEQRVASWVERRTIVKDLQDFLEKRARWSSSVYDSDATKQEVNDRRNSASSTATKASVGAEVQTSSTFSRSSRFKVAELLSRDAAQFAARVSTLRHTKISAAGKTLDKLIDDSRKPVPDVILDEQDKLEEKGVNEMDSIGSFVTSVIMQWRKADEIYVETIKDQSAAQTLIDDIKSARAKGLPDAHNSALFTSRCENVAKRLALRGNPASPSSTFPRPTNILFPDQPDANVSLTHSLSAELDSARLLIKEADRSVKDYCAAYEAVKRVGDLVRTAEEISTSMASLISKLENGVSSNEGDGSPPDLSSADCLQPAKHAVFLALLPTMLNEAANAESTAQKLLKNSRPALMALDGLGLDPFFEKTSAEKFQRLSDLCQQLQGLRDVVGGKVSRLRAARKIWTSMDNYLRNLDSIRRSLGEAMERDRWRQITTNEGAPPTPESPPAKALPLEKRSIPPSSEEVPMGLDEMIEKMSTDVEIPLSNLSRSLEPELYTTLRQSADNLKSILDQVNAMSHLLKEIKNQTEIMDAVRREYDSLKLRIEQTQLDLESEVDATLSDSSLVSRSSDPEREIDSIRSDVTSFSNGLSQRVPLLATYDTAPPRFRFIKKRFSSMDLKLESVSQGRNSVELPFELRHLDDSVRADSNSFVMRLNGAVQGLERKQDHLRLAVMAKDVDSNLATARTSLDAAFKKLHSVESSLRNVQSKLPINMESLDSMSKELQDDFQRQNEVIQRSLSSAYSVIEKMKDVPSIHDASIHERALLSRNRALKAVEESFENWKSAVGSTLIDIKSVKDKELTRLEEERKEAERLRQEEEKRLAAEEEERRRLEAERLRAEEERAAEEARLEEERLARAERERLAAEEVEKVRLEKERLEEEERQRVKAAEEKRLEEEQKRLAKEQAERERLEMEKKLLLAEQQLEEERRLLAQAERERIAAEEVERARLEKERLEEEERQRVKAAEEKRLEEEQKRLAKEQAERERLEMEKKLLLAERQLEEERRLQKEKELLAAAAAEKSRLELERLQVEHARSTEERRILAEKQRAAETRNKKVKSKEIASPLPSPAVQNFEEDVFGLRVAPSSAGHGLSALLLELQSKILSLRKRLRSLSINERARPLEGASGLPSSEEVCRIAEEFWRISDEVGALPESVDSQQVSSELRSLRSEMELSSELVRRLEALGQFSEIVARCDNALSDLLEHIDHYPTNPDPQSLSSSFRQPEGSPSEQMVARLRFTKEKIEEMSSAFPLVADDARAIEEQQRILQTWSELEEMAQDKMSGRLSRPSSSIASGRNSRASSGRNSQASDSSRKMSVYSSLSVSKSKPSRSRLPTPSKTSSFRRAVSGMMSPRPSSQNSTVSARSFSGPNGIYGAQTFASRQRTTSLTPATPRRPSGSGIRPRMSQSAQKKRSTSPSLSTSQHSYTSNRGTFSRAPRLSTPSRRAPTPKKMYKANPKNKLDVAVGDVVNKLPVNINIEGVADSWKDQSGKYWIGDQDPRLCFCRILRSQMVMVRVGGGWQELSKFIRSHFADSFRIFDSPPRMGGSEEKWISSATLLEQTEILDSPPLPPKTPEQRPHLGPNGLPSFSLSTPNGTSPRSVRTSSSTHSSPLSNSNMTSIGALTGLTPLQFIKRADSDAAPIPILRPATPSRSSPMRSRQSLGSTPARNSIWRP